MLVQGLARIPERKPDIVVHGHSHKYGVCKQDGILFINPGSAGPARFRLPRTAAILELQPKVYSACWCANGSRKCEAHDGCPYVLSVH